MAGRCNPQLIGVQWFSTPCATPHGDAELREKGRRKTASQSCFCAAFGQVRGSMRARQSARSRGGKASEPAR